jgi:hypothetical protein
LYIFLTLDIRGINNIRLISSSIHAPSHEFEDNDTSIPLTNVVSMHQGQTERAVALQEEEECG